MRSETDNGVRKASRVRGPCLPAHRFVDSVEPPVEILDETWGKGVAVVYVTDAAESQLLDQSVLQRLVHPFDPSLRLGRIGADDVDIQLTKCPAELGHSLRDPGGALVGHPEDAVLVAVKRHRLAVLSEVGPGRREVVEGRFRLLEPQLHEPPGRVVHEDEQRALGTSVFEPGVW